MKARYDLIFVGANPFFLRIPAVAFSFFGSVALFEGSEKFFLSNVVLTEGSKVCSEGGGLSFYSLLSRKVAG